MHEASRRGAFPLALECGCSPHVAAATIGGPGALRAARMGPCREATFDGLGPWRPTWAGGQAELVGPVGAKDVQASTQGNLLWG